MWHCGAARAACHLVLRRAWYVVNERHLHASSTTRHQKVWVRVCGGRKAGSCGSAWADLCGSLGIDVWVGQLECARNYLEMAGIR